MLDLNYFLKEKKLKIQYGCQGKLTGRLQFKISLTLNQVFL